MNNNKVAVIIPAFYKPDLTSEELISLKHLDKYLAKYDKLFIAPDNIDPNKYRQRDYRFIKFPKYYFSSTKTYNKLLLSKEFYQTFSDYKFILIYQLDALVFSKELSKWCNSGYDYIAAPWFRSIIATLTHKKNSPISGGNGGLSLRNVQKCLKVLDLVEKSSSRSSGKELIQMFWFFIAVITGKAHGKWLKAPAVNYPFNEDGFWSLEAPKYLPTFKVAPFRDALSFSFEKHPKKCFDLNKHKLPFGAHAWEKYNKDFWLPYLLK